MAISDDYYSTHKINKLLVKDSVDKKNAVLLQLAGRNPDLLYEIINSVDNAEALDFQAMFIEEFCGEPEHEAVVVESPPIDCNQIIRKDTPRGHVILSIAASALYCVAIFVRSDTSPPTEPIYQASVLFRSLREALDKFDVYVNQLSNI